MISLTYIHLVMIFLIIAAGWLKKTAMEILSEKIP